MCHYANAGDKSCADFTLKMHQKCLAAGLCPDRLEELTVHPSDPRYHILNMGRGRGQGRSDGGISGYTPPKKKSAQVNFLWGKIDIRTDIQQFYTPQKNYTPRNKFLATPLVEAETREWKKTGGREIGEEGGREWRGGEWVGRE